MYEFKIDRNGDAVEELTYRITFERRDATGKQRFVLRRIEGSEAFDPNAVGTVLAQGSTNEILTTATGLRFWAGKAGDPFWIEPDVLHAVGRAFQDGRAIDLTRWDPEKAKNRFFANILPDEVGTPARFGFVEWNGRSLTDNAPEVMFSIAANTPVRLGIGKESVTRRSFRTGLPQAARRTVSTGPAGC